MEHLSLSRYRALCYEALRENEDNLSQMIHEICSFGLVGAFIFVFIALEYLVERKARHSRRRLGRVLEGTQGDGRQKSPSGSP